MTDERSDFPAWEAVEVGAVASSHPRPLMPWHGEVIPIRLERSADPEHQRRAFDASRRRALTVICQTVCRMK